MQAKFDNNKVPTLLGVSSTDGVTPTRIQVNSSANAVLVDDGTTGSDLSGDNAVRDENGQTVLLAVSSADGTTIPLYVLNGKLLINSM